MVVSVVGVVVREFTREFEREFNDAEEAFSRVSGEGVGGVASSKMILLFLRLVVVFLVAG